METNAYFLYQLFLMKINFFVGKWFALDDFS